MVRGGYSLLWCGGGGCNSTMRSYVVAERGDAPGVAGVFVDTRDKVEEKFFKGDSGLNSCF